MSFLQPFCSLGEGYPRGELSQGWVIPGSGSLSVPAPLLVVSREQVSWGMLWALLLRISAAYLKPVGLYPEQTGAEPLIPPPFLPQQPGHFQPLPKERFASSLNIARVLKHTG